MRGFMGDTFFYAIQYCTYKNMPLTPFCLFGSIMLMMVMMIDDGDYT